MQLLKKKKKTTTILFGPCKSRRKNWIGESDCRSVLLHYFRIPLWRWGFVLGFVRAQHTVLGLGLVVLCFSALLEVDIYILSMWQHQWFLHHILHLLMSIYILESSFIATALPASAKMEHTGFAVSFLLSFAFPGLTADTFLRLYSSMCSCLQIQRGVNILWPSGSLATWGQCWYIELSLS